MTEALLTAEGVNGQIELTDAVVRIKRKGLMGFLTQGLKGDKDILVSQISSVQFKEAGFMNGYIQFAFLGGTENKGGMFDAPGDENTVVFKKGQQADFERIRDALMTRIATRGGAERPHTSAADEIERLASLRQKGILTEDEFQAAKRKALGI
jgi:hypothetical protein